MIIGSRYERRFNRIPPGPIQLADQQSGPMKLLTIGPNSIFRMRIRIANQLRRLRPAKVGAQNNIDDQVLKSVSEQDLLVLQLHARLPPAHALAPSEIAAELGLARNHAEKILTKLMRLRLLASALSGCDGEEAYKLTRAGRVCLIARMPPSRQTA